MHVHPCIWGFRCGRRFFPWNVVDVSSLWAAPVDGLACILQQRFEHAVAIFPRLTAILTFSMQRIPAFHPYRRTFTAWSWAGRVQSRREACF